MGPLIFFAFGIAAVAWFVWDQVRARRRRSATWESLVAALQPVSARGLELVARDFLEPGSGNFWESGSQTRLEPFELWELLGNDEGLERMAHNAEIMVRLAAYVQVWNVTEAVVVAHRIRHDAILMKRAIFRFQVASMFGRRGLNAPVYFQQAATQYYLMKQRLLALYENTQFVLYPRLQEAL